MKRTIAALSVLVALSGCAGRPPQNISIVQPQDQFSACTAIQAEIQDNNRRIAELNSETGGKVAQNVAAGLAGLVIWPLWFAMDFQGSASTDAAALQSRQQYLGTMAAQKHCGIASSALPQGGQSRPTGEAMVAMVQTASFDGQYAGVSRISGARPRDFEGRAGAYVAPGCRFSNGVPVPLTIRNGIIYSSAWRGYVGAAGAIVMQNRRGDQVQGTIAGNAIHGEYWGQQCVVTFIWQKTG